MSKAVKQGIVLLAVLLVVTLGLAFFIWVEKQKLQNENKSLVDQVADYQAKQTQLIAEGAKLKDQVQSLNTQLAEKDKDRSKYQSQYEELKDKYDQLNNQISQLSQEREDLKERASTITQERDRLMKELQNRPEKIVEKVVYKDREPSATQSAAPAMPMTTAASAISPAATSAASDASSVVAEAQAESAKQQKDESHWAEIIKEKASLELELEKAKKELDQSAIQIVELKKQSSDFQLEIDKLKNEKAEVMRKIKYGEDLADNLSIELARAKNDQKFIAERADKISAENGTLRSQVKQLTDIKLGLEKTIQRLNDDKAEIQRKLVESESVIQSRIDDIYKIKKSVDQRFQNLSDKTSVELSPIVVNAGGGNATANSQAAPTANIVNAEPQAGQASSPRMKNEGHIVSINTDNNFVIIDIGEKDGAKIGNGYRVFRNNKEIAKLEVIQVRRDISAADIKKRVTALQVGDQVR